MPKAQAEPQERCPHVCPQHPVDKAERILVNVATAAAFVTVVVAALSAITFGVVWIWERML